MSTGQLWVTIRCGGCGGQHTMPVKAYAKIEVQPCDTCVPRKPPKPRKRERT